MIQRHLKTQHLQLLLLVTCLLATFLVVTDVEASSTISGVSGGVDNFYKVYKDFVKTVVGKIIVFGLVVCGFLSVTDRKDYSALAQNMGWAGVVGAGIIFAPNIADGAFSTGATI